ncbi:aquaporin Z [Pseudomonas arsenicoxydans]|uniref:Aquaporin Z n=1 Tax=Pseudomonas arsenicoxydans TaxID=702115 RepID=A0A502GPM1_9PSED|nr:aquaporin Z [Pseudomonas arsenicoxydans]TPG63834.1 aquaporin Z [Pseudomonas arsenicoxydans]
MKQRLAAEFLGMFWLTFGGCGSAILAAAFPELGIGFAGVALAFCLTVLTMAYALGYLPGGHFNPAFTISLWAGKRISAKDVIPYIVAQVLGAIAAAATLYFIASGKPSFELDGFAANGFDELSLGNYSLSAALAVELISTLIFVFIILRVTAPGAAVGFAPLAIGLTLPLIHFISIPVSNTSVTPARSTGPALFADDAYLSQLWLFWLAPIAGGVLGALAANGLGAKQTDQTTQST